MFHFPTRQSLFHPRVLAVSGAVAAAVALAACGSSSSTSSQPKSAAGSSTSHATSFSTANVQGLGSVVVDGRGRTVYILTSGGHTNVPCTGATGCTKVWPDLPLPSGVTAAKAGGGIQASLLGTMKLSDGRTYPTYNGWLVYEFSGDSGVGQGNGQGIKSFGGTWYALDASGNPVGSSSTSSGGGGSTGSSGSGSTGSTGSGGSGGGGYGGAGY